jgi:frataxin-like iron-binding protein CyaY
MKRIAIIALVCLLVGGGLAYLASYLIYTPQIEDYLTKINEQYDEISKLVQMNCDLQHSVTSQESLLASQQAEIEALEAEIANQEQIIINKDALITALELEKNSLQEQLSDGG